jgi:segregation and condensation protein A
MSTPPAQVSKPDLAGLSAEDLRKALAEALSAPLQRAQPQEILPMPRVRLRDKIVQILVAIRGAGSTTFSRMVRLAKTRLEIVVSFLAMLELIKQRQVIAQQAELFGDISITPGEQWQDDQGAEFELEFEE